MIFDDNDLETFQQKENLLLWKNRKLRIILDATL